MEEITKQHKKFIRFFNNREVRAVWGMKIIVGGSLRQILLEQSITNLTTLRLETIGDG